MIARPTVGITVGDPAGIGPEIALKTAGDAWLREVCRIALYGPTSDGELAAFARGRVSAAAGRAAYDAILRAVEDARQG